ncbi:MULTISPECIES: class I adenylate-forming enzyme family protein [Paracoccus]|uniref:class I adenylate-forming enzyme family protein n=1 Tax=Paracoccus TaxID=265 RepID=UPI0022F111A7|nr:MULTISPECIES: class I adenylate-forming enzyme family protein [Paracoccus]WBU58489.1 class I adenylate-forming enzyme family protein [Paracoccus sediminicola]WBU64691.1 class I adenylate-forming enzyme family protein [Paracoccus aerodenitrificans]
MTLTRVHDLLDIQRCTRPDAPALRDDGGSTYSYAELADAVEVLATELQARDLRPGDRLLILAENCAALVGLLMATSRLDAVAVPVNARMTEHELHRIAEHADPRLTVYLNHVSPQAGTHAEIAGAAGWDTPLGKLSIAGPHPSATPEPVAEGAAQTAVILYTTGSTGTPKGVMLSHANLLFGGQTSARMREIASDDLILGVLPMTHVFGLTSMMIASTVAGAELWLFPRFSAPAVVEALQSGVSVLPAVPQMHALIMDEVSKSGRGRLPPGRLRYVSSGAAPLDPDWKRRAEAFYGVALQNGYGLTETTAGVTLTTNPPGVPDVSVGPALPGVDLRLRNVGADGVGEIQTRGPHVMPGYFRNPEATAAAFDAEGFLCTGDLGRIDSDGNLHIAGRSRELIIRGGFNVYPPEVEAALNDHPRVVQTAVIGRKVEGGNEEVLAFCQADDPAVVSEADLREHVAERLSPYKRPSRIIVTTALPTSPNGKILKQKLIETFRDALDTKEEG